MNSNTNVAVRTSTKDLDRFRRKGHLNKAIRQVCFITSFDWIDCINYFDHREMNLEYRIAHFCIKVK